MRALHWSMYQQDKKLGPKDASRRPKHLPNAPVKYWRLRIVEACARLKAIGKRKSAAYILQDPGVPVSLPTVLKVMEQEDYFEGRRRIVQNNRDMRAEKTL